MAYRSRQKPIYISSLTYSDQKRPLVSLKSESHLNPPPSLNFKTPKSPKIYKIPSESPQNQGSQHIYTSPGQKFSFSDLKSNEKIQNLAYASHVERPKTSRKKASLCPEYFHVQLPAKVRRMHTKSHLEKRVHRPQRQIYTLRNKGLKLKTYTRSQIVCVDNKLVRSTRIKPKDLDHSPALSSDEGSTKFISENQLPREFFGAKFAVHTASRNKEFTSQDVFDIFEDESGVVNSINLPQAPNCFKMSDIRCARNPVLEKLKRTILSQSKEMATEEHEGDPQRRAISIMQPRQK